VQGHGGWDVVEKQQQPKDMFDPALKALPLDEQRQALLEQAERCRRLASSLYSRDSRIVLEKMAEGFQRTADQLIEGGLE
jgi:hypothetical protein